MAHKLDRRLTALEAQLATPADPVTEIYLVAPNGEVPPVHYWSAAHAGTAKPAA